MSKIQFLNPEVKPGKNVTVRLGTKWMVEPGIPLGVVKTGEEDEVLAIGYVYSTRSCVFNELNEGDLVDCACRTVEGLRDAMKRAYGDEFTDESIVTVLGFTVPA